METRARALLAAGNVAAGLRCRITPGQNVGGPDRSVPVRRARRLERNDAKPLLDREHARMRVGAVTVPFGTFTERPTSSRRSCVPIPVPPPGMWALPHRPLLPSGLRDYPKDGAGVQSRCANEPRLRDAHTVERVAGPLH